MRIPVRLIYGLVLVAPIAVPLAQTPQGPVEHERIAVSLRLNATRPGGAAGVTGSGDASLAPGDRRSVYVSATAGLCSASVGGTDIALDRFEPPEFVEHLWWADVELLEGGLEEIRLQIDWQRLDRNGSDMVRTKGGRRTIALREGEHHMLDFVAEPQLDKGQVCYDNLLVDLTAVILEDAELSHQMLRYELWFVDEGPGRERRTARVGAVGKQGDQVSFQFEPLRWRIAEDVFEAGADADLVLDPSASVRGRLRRDGSIAVELSADRWLGVAAEGQPRSGGIGDGGRKIFTVVPGETVKLVLPAPQGSHGLWRTGGPSARLRVSPDRGVVLDEKELRAHNPSFFEGHEMSLLLTVTRP